MEHWVEEGRRLVLDLEDVVEVHIRIVGGEVSVGATSGPARLEAECLRGEAVRVELADGVLIVEHRQQESTSWFSIGRPTIEALVAVTVPPDVPVDVTSVSAPIVAAGLAGDVELKTVSGDVTCSYLTGAASVTTVSGEVDVDGVSGRFQAGTVSGDVTVNAGCVTDFDAKTVSGELTLDLDVKPEGTYHMTTVSGDVAVRIPEDASMSLNATTLSGDLAAQFELADESASKRRLRGRIGAGEATMKVNTLSGDFVLLSRGPEAYARMELAR